MKQEKIKQSRLEKAHFTYLKELMDSEGAVFYSVIFKDKGKITSIKIKRINTPQIDVKEQTRSLKNRMSVLKDATSLSEEHLEPRSENRGRQIRGSMPVIADNQHPVENYVRLNDVLGLFKNRKATKLKLIDRKRIVERINKLLKKGL